MEEGNSGAQMTVGEVAVQLEVNPELGLNDDEASKRFQKYGPNETPEPPSTPYWKLILAQFEDVLVKILLGSAVVSFVLACFEDEEGSVTAFVEPFVILVILILNAVVGVWQESNAEAAIAALKKYAAPTALVIRDGVEKTIKAREVVPGDIVKVAVGDQVPADLRVCTLNSTTLQLDQAVLNGESEAAMKIPEVEKNKAERWSHNLLFAGTSVCYGKGTGIVVKTGTETEYGKIESSMREEEEVVSPLKKKLDEFGDLLTKVITVICILVWLVNIGHFSEHGTWSKGAIYYLKIAIALAVAAIPEGLPAVVTTCLALGTRKMAQRNALIRNLPSVETLGCTTVICSDKTGTLTTNMMSVQKVCFFNKQGMVEADVTDTKFNIANDSIQLGGAPLEHPVAAERAFAEIGKICALCNDSTLEYDAATGQVSRAGEATEAALRVLSEKIGLPDAAAHRALNGLSPEARTTACSKFWTENFKKEATLEFTRSRKSMSVVCRDNATNQTMLFAKGAPEMLLERCNSIQLSNGEVVELRREQRNALNDKLMELGTGKSTLRCLGLAFKKCNPSKEEMADPVHFERVESDMTFVGIAGMLDPPRMEVKSAIEECHSAGIRVIVITGDNKATAEAICKRIGVFDEEEDLAGKSYTGAEFDALDEDGKNRAVKAARLFSRTDPAHKMNLVKYLQAQGEVCAMTGDGVNDAPALKKADIGIAMGTGTEVAKAASKMVLSDDNFATIVAAVEQGRAIYNNTKQFIRYLISSNIGEVVCIFLTAMLGLPEALVPVQLLWVNLVTDGLPATALGFNPADPDIMEKKPRKSTEPIVNGWLFARYMVIGVYVGVATVFGFAWWFLWFEQGPQMTFSELTNFHSCTDKTFTFPNGKTAGCSIFESAPPRTIALSVLVTVEMFNALNALSEDQSLLVVSPFKNIWLLLAIALSFALHFMILYVQPFPEIFGIAPLNWAEWKGVIWISFPVIILDEILKLVSRLLVARSAKAGKAKQE